jgi:small conductance mechanosensitive channel
MKEIFLNEKIIHPIIIILVLWLIYFVFHKIVKKLVRTKTGIKGIDSKKNKTIIILINNLVKYFLILVGIIMILNVFGVDTTSLIASLGVASAVIALAFQDTLKDFLAGIFIILENQYNIGDTVTINGFKGEVMAVGLRTTRLKSITGESCFIANHNIGDVINHSINKSLAVVKVQVSYEDDLEKVDKVLNNLAKKLETELPNLQGPINVDGIEELGDSGITFRISVETKPLKQIEVERLLRKEIKLELDRNKITIPYPQMVVHKDEL